MNKYCISYCLYGENEKYRGNVEKIIDNNSKFSNFDTIIYCDDSNYNLFNECRIDYKNIKICKPENFKFLPPMYWRFIPIVSDIYDVVFVRDIDASIGTLEKELMDRFLTTDKLLHVIRDHPYHYWPVMGGLFGLKKSKYHLLNLDKINHKKFNYADDQFFLSKYLYNEIKKTDILINSSCVYFKDESPIFFKSDDNYIIGLNPKINSYEIDVLMKIRNKYSKLFYPHHSFHIFLWRYPVVMFKLGEFFYKLYSILAKKKLPSL